MAEYIDGRRFVLTAPWIATFPGVAISLTILGFNLVAGDFYFTVLGWQSDSRLRMLGDMFLTICYSAWFSIAARTAVLMAVRRAESEG